MLRCVSLAIVETDHRAKGMSRKSGGFCEHEHVTLSVAGKLDVCLFVYYFMLTLSVMSLFPFTALFRFYYS